MPSSGFTKENKPNDSFDFQEIVSWPQLTEEKLADHVIFPEELNLILRDRIRDLSAENGCLRRSLEEAEEKITSKKSDDTTASTFSLLGKSNEVAATKIIELSKKCREQRAEVEVLKSKCKSLEASLAKKEVELDNAKFVQQKQLNKKDLQSRESTEIDSTDSQTGAVVYLTEKLHQIQTKYYETKNTCASLKQEINKAQKLLSSEVGDNITIASLSSQPGGWRGRAEQIRLLQQKLTEVQTRLSDYEGTQKLERKSSVSVNVRNAAEKERRQEIENTAKKLRQAELTVETQKRKLEASKARIKVLEHELNLAKGNVGVLNEKRSHDDRLIEALNSRLKATELRYQDREADMRNKEEKFERECTNLKNELQSAQLQIDRLRARIDERETEIDKLRSGGRIPKLETSNKYERIFQLEMHSNKGRQHHSNISSPPHSFRSSSNEYVTLALAAESERERLLELVSMLNRRLDKERSDADILSESLRNERNKAAKLELKVRKFEQERVGIAKIDSGYKTKFLLKSSKANREADQSSAEETRLKMELLEEECLALKARLDTVQQDKASDLVMYKRVIDQVRQIFQDACRTKPSTNVGSRSTITI